MGTWSISPSSDKASIDQNGKATFGRHETEDIEYTITYTPSEGEDCGTTPLTIKHTVKKCGENPPIPVEGIHITDNMGQICNCSKCVKSDCLADVAPSMSDEECEYGECVDCQGKKHWWSGPIDGHGDTGESQTEHVTEGDSILYDIGELANTQAKAIAVIGTGTIGRSDADEDGFVSEYKPENAPFSAVCISPWIKVKVSVDPHQFNDGYSPGWISYKLLKNEDTSTYGGKVRQGEAEIITTGGTSTFDWGKGYQGQDYTKGGKVIFYQLGPNCNS